MPCNISECKREPYVDIDHAWWGTEFNTPVLTSLVQSLSLIVLYDTDYIIMTPFQFKYQVGISSAFSASFRDFVAEGHTTVGIDRLARCKYRERSESGSTAMCARPSVRTSAPFSNNSQVLHVPMPV